MNETTNTNKPAVLPLDEFNGASVTIPVAKFYQIVTDLARAQTQNDEMSTKYWQLRSENETLKKQLEELRS